MSEDSKEIKKRVAAEWLSYFPLLSAFAQNKLYRIAGSCIVGIELIKLPHSEAYRPNFVIYALWRSSIKKCLDAPVLMKQLYNRKGLQFNIPYEKHTSFFDDAIECFKKQIPILFDENVALKALFDLVDNSFNEILIKTNSAEQAKLFELKFYSALYTENKSQVKNVLNQIQQASKNWNMQMFEMWYGKFDLWLQGLQEKANSQGDFIKQIEANKQDKKISQLKSSELTA
jgi:3-methyladenine DNA glycosylase AlkC